MPVHIDQPAYQPGDIVLTANPSWLGKLIRFGTQARGESRTLVNHVGCIVGYDGTLVEALHSVESHNIVRYYGRLEDRVAIYRPTNIREDSRWKIAFHMETAVGSRYGYAKIGLHIFDGLLGKLGIPPLFARLSFLDDYPICSYLVAQAYASEGYHFGVEANRATPDDIYDFVTAPGAPYVCVRELAAIEKV